MANLATVKTWKLNLDMEDTWLKYKFSQDDQSKVISIECSLYGKHEKTYQESFHAALIRGLQHATTLLVVYSVQFILGSTVVNCTILLPGKTCYTYLVNCYTKSIMQSIFGYTKKGTNWNAEAYSNWIRLNR